MPACESIFPFDTERADRRATALVQDMIGTLRTTVRLARTLALTDRAVDLAGLDRDVGLLCARALDLPHKSGARLRPLLHALFEDIEALSLTLAPAEPGRC